MGFAGILLLMATVVCQSHTLGALRGASAQRPDPARPARVTSFEELTLERTSCLGWCPSYRIVIGPDGRVAYEGKDYVMMRGHRFARLSRRQIARLLTAINEVNYLALRETYIDQSDGCPIVETDHPSTITSLRVGGVTKTVRHYGGCRELPTGDKRWPTYPPGLESFEQQIDDVVGTKRWLGSEQYRQRTFRRRQRAPN